nr:hypothetical protein [Anaerolineae bacterium]
MMKKSPLKLTLPKHMAFLTVTIFALSILAAGCGPATPEPGAIETAIFLTQQAEEGADAVDVISEEQATNTPYPSATPQPPTETPSPSPEPVASAEDHWAKNYVGTYDNGDIVLEIARIVVGYKDAIGDQDWDVLNDYIEGWADVEVVGELVFKVTNNSEKTVSLYPDQGTVQIGSEQIPLDEFMFYTTFGDDVGGEIFPGVTKIGGMWFAIERSAPDEITQIIYRASAPFDEETFNNIGPDIEIVIDISEYVFEELPEELH